jgi:hypothetical protein
MLESDAPEQDGMSAKFHRVPFPREQQHLDPATEPTTNASGTAYDEADED